MPTLIPHHRVVVQRNGKNIRLPLGKPFAFTDEEVKFIRAANRDALRRPINESREPEVTSELAEPEVTSEAVDDAVDDLTDDVADDVAATPVKRRPGTRRAATPAPAAAEDDEL